MGVLYGGTGLTSAPAYGQVLVGNSSGGYTLTATSSLGISGGSSLFTDGGNTTYLTSSDVLGIGTTTAGSKLSVFGDLFVEGSSRYLNFGTATGTNGYGFRDNSGTLEFKNSGGSWQGVTTATSGPSFFVHRNGSATTTVASNYVRLDFTNETFDTNSNFDLSTDRFTPTVPGKYLLTFHVYCDDSTSFCGSIIRKNGSAVSTTWGQAGGNANSSSITTVVADANGSTDYFEAYVWSNGTSIDGQTNNTSFSGALIAPTAAVNGVWSISDERFKENIATTTYGLDLLTRIPILDFNLIGDPEHRQQGFIAQELYKYYPDAVVVGGENQFQNPWLVDYGRITPLLAKSIQDLNLKLEGLATTSATSTDQSTFTSRFFASLFARLTQWFADTTNGIKSFFAQRVQTKELCVDDVCVTRDQFAEVFGISQTSAAAGAPVSPTEAPSGSSAPSQEGTDIGSTTTPSATTTPPSEDIANEPAADAPALGESEAPADVSEGGSDTGGVDDTASADASPVPQSTPEPSLAAPANSNIISSPPAEQSTAVNE
jgi:hypothetical protein